MIQTFDKVLGEANDPNTVIAIDTLTEGELVIGAGNKGIKTINVGTKKLLYTNNEAKLATFDFNAPNKCICTDSAGNLVLKNRRFFQDILINSVSINDKTASTTVHVYNVGDTDLPANIVNIFEKEGLISIIEIVDVENILVNIFCSLKVPFQTGYMSHTPRLILSIVPEYLDSNITNSDFYVEGIQLISSNGEVCSVVSDDVSKGFSVNKVLQLKSGAYSIMLIRGFQPVKVGTYYLKITGCFSGELG